MAVAARVAERAAVWMERREDGEDGTEEPELGALYNASITGRIATGPNAGRRVKTLGQITASVHAGEEDSFQSGTVRCAQVSGFSVHAGVGIRAEDRKGLERLCRYASRPPVATERLEHRPDGRLSYRLKTPWRNGTTHVLFEPEELLEKLAALIPAPRLNLTRFHGVLAPAAKWRPSIVPAPPVGTPTVCGCGASKGVK